MNTFAIHRLNEGVRASLVAHFLSLPMRDRSSRFGAAVAPAGIAAYVNGIDFDRDAVLGVHDGSLALVGVAHIAFQDDLAELGLSVLPAHRRRGVGSALFKWALAHARNRNVPRLLMHFLSGNLPIMRIARKFGMAIVAGGCEVDAYLGLLPARRAEPDAR